MPLVSLHLVSLAVPAPRFLSVFRTVVPPDSVVAVSQPRYLYIPASAIDREVLNTTRWDLLLLLNTTSSLPVPLRALVSRSYTLTVGIPGKLLANYPSRNAFLLRTAPSVALSGALDAALAQPSAAERSGAELELSDSLLRFMEEMLANGEGSRPVSMLNLLCFREGKKAEYVKYGQGFQSAGGRRGGEAKVVGKVTEGAGGEGKEGRWDEIAFVHYPSIRHFCDMTAGEDYQDINHKYRLGVSRRFLVHL